MSRMVQTHGLAEASLKWRPSRLINLPLPWPVREREESNGSYSLARGSSSDVWRSLTLPWGSCAYLRINGVSSYQGSYLFGYRVEPILGKDRDWLSSNVEMYRSSEPTGMGRRASEDREKQQRLSRRSRSPQRDVQRGGSPCPRPGIEVDATPRPLNFAVFVKNKPMTEADSIIEDPDVAVEFARQIFPPEVRQSMVGRRDFEVFRDGIHGAVKGLYNANEIGMRLRAMRRDIEKKEERNRSLEARAKKAESELRELKKVLMAEPAAAVQLKVGGNTSQKAPGYEKGYQDGFKAGVDKTKTDLAEEVCRCENRGFKHGWIKALQTVEVLGSLGIDSASPLYHRHYLPYSEFEMEKSDDEGAD